MDRIEAMRAFVAVVNTGSFTGAAERLGISPQLVSKYVSQLEQKLNARLLNRTTRKVHQTEAGSRYFIGAQQVLNDIDDMDSQLGEMHDYAQGQLRISAPVSFAMEHLAPFLADFQQHYPQVDVDLQLNDRKVNIVEEGFDIAIRIGQLKSSSLVAKRIASVRVVACASPDYLAKYGTPTCLEDLAEHRYLRYSYAQHDTSSPLLEWLSKKNKGINAPEFVSNNGELLTRAAVQGAGIIVQPTFITAQAIKEGKLQVLLPEYEPEPLGLYVVYAHRQLLASKVSRFLDLIDGYFGDPPYWDACVNNRQPI
jgi:DNA-binding transcriptional LysR family regulator